MESTAATTVTITPAFPSSAVAACLRDELLSAVCAEAELSGVSLPSTPDLIVAAPIEIDSLTVVEILCALDDILPFAVGESVVRAGGYESITSAIEHVRNRIEKEWSAHHKGGKS